MGDKIVGIITNMNSKRNKSGRFSKEKLQPILGDLGIVIDTYSIEEMQEAVQRLREENITFLGVNGGDGSLQKVITEWIRQGGEDSLPRIIPMAGGSTNALILYTRKRPESPIRTLEKFVKKYKNYSLMYMENNILRVIMEGEDLPPQYGITFANGVVYKFVELYLSNNKPGVRWVLRTIMEIIGGITMRIDRYLYYLEKINAVVTVDGKRYPSNQILSSIISTLKTPFPTLTVFRNVERDVNQFYYVVSDLGFPTILNNIHNILFGMGDVVKGPNSGDFWIGAARQVVERTKEGFMLDGELFKPSECEDIIIESGPTLTLTIL